MNTIKKLIKDYGDARTSLNKLSREETPWADMHANERTNIRIKILTLRLNAKEYVSKDEVKMKRANMIYEATFEMEDELDSLGGIPDED